MRAAPVAQNVPRGARHADARLDAQEQGGMMDRIVRRMKRAARGTSREARGAGESPDGGKGRIERIVGWLVSGLAPLALLALALTLGGKLVSALASLNLGSPSGSARLADTYGLIILALTAVVSVAWGFKPAGVALGEGALGLAGIIFVRHLTLAALGGWVLVDAALVVVALAALEAMTARLARTRREMARLKEGMAWERAQVEAARPAPPDRPDDQSRMDAFIGLAGHELRTPLTTIKASVQLALRKLDRTSQPALLDEDLRGLLTRTDRQVTRMARLVEDLLDTSRAASGQLALRLELCDLVTLARGVVRDARQRAPGRVVLLEVDGDTALVWGDAARLAQVVERYLSNALKFSDPRQPVEARVWGRWRAHEAGGANGWLARVEVRDHGPGIKPEALEWVWDRFYQDPELAARVGSEVGLGLGLYLCRAIIEAHGGAVGVENASDGGSLFWFTLPALAG